MFAPPNWEKTRERFIAWWNHSCLDRPLVGLQVRRDMPVAGAPEPAPPTTPEERFLDIERIVRNRRAREGTNMGMGEWFPVLDANVGAGSLALYLGCEPGLSMETVWFKECIDDWSTFEGFRYDGTNYWWNRHRDMMRKAVELVGDDFVVAIPDLVENLDILAAMRGTQKLCMDLVMEPDAVHKALEQLDSVYFEYYDRMYDIVKLPDNSSVYTAFGIWGPGKVAKVQCDFCALISPEHFREFVVPSLRRQCATLDFSLFHLDGPDAVKHVDALMEVGDLDALQFEYGAGNPEGGHECWYPIYDKVRAAGKSLEICVDAGNTDRALERADRIIKRYGPDGIFFAFRPLLSQEQGERILSHADLHWRCKG